MAVLVWGMVRGDLGLPGSPPQLEPLYPRRAGALLWSLLPHGCISMLLTFLPLFTASSVWFEPAGPSTSRQAASWHSSLAPERSGWLGQAGVGTPTGLCTGETPDQHWGQLETRSPAELLDTGTTKHLTTHHESSTDGYFKQP